MTLILNGSSVIWHFKMWQLNRNTHRKTFRDYLNLLQHKGTPFRCEQHYIDSVNNRSLPVVPSVDTHPLNLRLPLHCTTDKILLYQKPRGRGSTQLETHEHKRVRSLNEVVHTHLYALYMPCHTENCLVSYNDWQLNLRTQTNLSPIHPTYSISYNYFDYIRRGTFTTTPSSGCLLSEVTVPEQLCQKDKNMQSHRKAKN